MRLYIGIVIGVIINSFVWFFWIKAEKVFKKWNCSRKEKNRIKEIMKEKAREKKKSEELIKAQKEFRSTEGFRIFVHKKQDSCEDCLLEKSKRCKNPYRCYKCGTVVCPEERYALRDWHAIPESRSHLFCSLWRTKKNYLIKRHKEFGYPVDYLLNKIMEK